MLNKRMAQSIFGSKTDKELLKNVLPKSFNMNTFCVQSLDFYSF